MIYIAEHIIKHLRNRNTFPPKWFVKKIRQLQLLFYSQPYNETSQDLKSWTTKVIVTLSNIVCYYPN